MARRVLNRRELRKAADQADQAPEEQEVKAPSKRGKKAQAGGGETTAAPKVKRPRKKKEPPRLCARWGVFDASMKQVAIFDYNQLAEANQKIAELAAKKSAIYFLQLVKEPMAEPTPKEEGE
jgi:hypothetical protein